MDGLLASVLALLEVGGESQLERPDHALGSSLISRDKSSISLVFELESDCHEECDLLYPPHQHSAA